ncbi:hypothetical protein [Paenibacillus sp. J22TS3]|uniref:hypothetical protein n=1 Tax=Paenibacillus sp. J22TS3 TaxID=2807192 RepID=UPI001BCAFDBF|nr:hypothetical protein [Paenibacillus sp. J22TS3]
MDSNLKLVARFLLNGQAWKLTGIDDFSKPGTAALTCAKDSITQTDDLIKGVTRAIYADNKTGTTTFAKITNQTGTSCIVSGEAIGYIQLKATLVNDPSVYSWQRSQVKSMI